MGKLERKLAVITGGSTGIGLAASGNRETLHENFAVELTNAAYAVARRHSVEDKWLDLELELWEAMNEAVKKWAQGSPHFSAMPFVSD
jgi:hypothetical protein